MPPSLSYGLAHTGKQLFLLLACLGTVVAGCGSKGSPTEPGPGSTAGLSSPSGFGISEISVKNRTVTFTWNAVAAATGYVMEIGRTTNGTEFAVIKLEGGATTHRVTDMPVGFSFARVRATNSTTTTAAGTDLRFIVPDIRDIIEALFLGTGPNAYDPIADPNGPNVLWAPWPLGRHIQTRVAGLNDQEYGYVEQSLRQVEEASDGSLRGNIVERLGEPFGLNDLFRLGEFRITVHSDMQAYCGNSSFGACAVTGSLIPPGVVGSTYLAVRPSQPGDVYAHEIGHAVLGLKHLKWSAFTTVNETSWPGLPRPTMFPGATGGPAVLSPTEMDAVKMTFAAGITGGARRSAFSAAGLINP